MDSKQAFEEFREDFYEGWKSSRDAEIADLRAQLVTANESRQKMHDAITFHARHCSTFESALAHLVKRGDETAAAVALRTEEVIKIVEKEGNEAWPFPTAKIVESIRSLPSDLNVLERHDAAMRLLLGEAIIPLATILLQHRDKPYRELSPELIESIQKAHDQILAMPDAAILARYDAKE